MEIGTEPGETSMKLYNELTGIQWGRIEGPEGWSMEVPHKDR